MKEFLIRRKDGDFCLFNISKFSEVLHPVTYESKKIDGWGDYRISVEGCEVSFSFEAVGIQIGFENCDINDLTAEKNIKEICDKVEREVNSSCYWIEL